MAEVGDVPHDRSGRPRHPRPRRRQHDARTCTTSAATCRLPDFFDQMLERKWLGDKTKGGFYKKSKGHDGKEDERLALDWKTLEYHPRQKPKFAALDMAKNIEDTGTRLRTLLGLDGSAPQKGDKAGAFLWARSRDLWTYSANRVPEISDSVVEIDRAMRLGFNWELGPFELWDAAGVEATVARMKKEGKPVAANVERLLASGQKSWYIDDPKSPSGRKYWEIGNGKLGTGAGSRQACGRSPSRRNPTAW